MENTMTETNNVAVDTPPEVTGEQAVTDPTIVGKLTSQEMQAIATLRQHGSQVTMEIGNLEIKKARLLGNLSTLETQAQNIMNEAGKRMGIPDGQPWQVTPDGSVRIPQTPS